MPGCLPTKDIGANAAWRNSPGFVPPFVPSAGTPYVSSPTGPDHLCGECSLSDPFFDTARSAVEHTGIVRDRIHQLKFGGRLHWVPSLVELTLHPFRNSCPGPVDLLLPVPLHIQRLKQRGFNQSALMAKTLGRTLKCPVSFDTLVRTRWTNPQTRLSREERLENVKGSFSVEAAGRVKGKSVLLLDDVFTTGTTLMECSRALKKAGAREVHALTVTRALRR